MSLLTKDQSDRLYGIYRDRLSQRLSKMPDIEHQLFIDNQDYADQILIEVFGDCFEEIFEVYKETDYYKESYGSF